MDNNMNISEKVAYIKGLAEGLSLDETTKEGKILAAVIEVLDDMAAEIDDIEETVADMGEQVDAVDEDLSNLEDVIYDDCEDDECDCDCCDDDEVYEVECPNCHDLIYVDEEMLEEEGIDCPNCGTPLEFDFEGCCDGDCDCGCCGDSEE